MASEAGVVPVEPERVLRKGRLKPGRMFLVDFDLGRIVADEELKSGIASQRPYAEWLERRTDLADLVAHSASNGNAPANQAAMDDDALTRSLQAFGYTGETMRFMLRPLIEEQRDPIGSMGNDTRPRLPLRPGPPGLRLLQAALRPGHEPGDRLDPRGGRHVGRLHDRPRAQPARDEPPTTACASGCRIRS